MGLMQLLTVGRSLSEARDQPHRYKLRTDRWPSLCEERAVVDRVETWGNETVAAERAMNTEMEILAQKNAEAVKAPYPHGRWTLGVNPFKGRRQGPATASRQGGTVQGELSLDRVRPIRNELNEADLELIPVRRSDVSVAENKNVFGAPVPLAPLKAPQQTWWASLKARLKRSKTK